MGQQEYIEQCEAHSISARETRIAVEKKTAPKGTYGSYRLGVLVLNALTTIVALTKATATTTLTYIISNSIS